MTRSEARAHCVAEISAQLSDLVEAHSRGGTPRASASASGKVATTLGGGEGVAEGGNSGSTDADLDTDLEAYLQVWART